MLKSLAVCPRKAYGQTQHQLFFVAEMCTVFKSRQVTQLFFGDSDFSAHGRMNVDSKRTAYHRRDFELGQLFQLWRERSAGRRDPTGGVPEQRSDVRLLSMRAH